MISITDSNQRIPNTIRQSFWRTTHCAAMPTSNAAGPKGTGGKSFPDYQRMAEERGDSPGIWTCDGIRIRPPPMDKAPPGVKAPPIPHPPVTHPAGKTAPFKVPPTPSNPNPPPSLPCTIKAPPRSASANVPSTQPVPISAAPKVSHWPTNPFSVTQQKKIKHGQDPYERRQEPRMTRGRSP